MALLGAEPQKSFGGNADSLPEPSSYNIPAPCLQGQSQSIPPCGLKNLISKGFLSSFSGILFLTPSMQNAQKQNANTCFLFLLPKSHSLSGQLLSPDCQTLNKDSKLWNKENTVCGEGERVTVWESRIRTFASVPRFIPGTVPRSLQRLPWLRQSPHYWEMKGNLYLGLM